MMHPSYSLAPFEFNVARGNRVIMIRFLRLGMKHIQ